MPCGFIVAYQGERVVWDRINTYRSILRDATKARFSLGKALLCPTNSQGIF